MEQQDLLTAQTREQLVEQSIETHYKGLCRMAYRYVHNEQDAQDIVQETAYKAIKSCHSLREPQYVVTWLYQILRNEAVSFLRKHKAVCVPLYEADGEQETRFSDVDLQCAMKQLNTGEKAVVLLRYFAGMSFQQIAETLQENMNTVKTRLYRALQKLKSLLEEPGVVASNTRRGVRL